MKRLFNQFGQGLHLKITGVHPPRGFLSATTTLGILLGLGTVFYHYEEGWSFFDSFYFTVITITTVGYGDLHPTTTASKAFTLFLIFTGVGLGLYVINAFSDSLRQGRESRMEKIERLLRKTLGQ